MEINIKSVENLRLEVRKELRKIGLTISTLINEKRIHVAFNKDYDLNKVDNNLKAIETVIEVLRDREYWLNRQDDEYTGHINQHYSNLEKETIGSNLKNPPPFTEHQFIQLPQMSSFTQPQTFGSVSPIQPQMNSDSDVMHRAMINDFANACNLKSATPVQPEKQQELEFSDKYFYMDEKNRYVPKGYVLNDNSKLVSNGEIVPMLIQKNLVFNNNMLIGLKGYYIDNKLGLLPYLPGTAPTTVQPSPCAF